MRLQSKQGVDLATVTLFEGNGALSAQVALGESKLTTPEVETSIKKVGSDLVAHIRVPGVANFNLVLEPSDIKALKGMMNKDAIGFMMSAFFK